MADATLPNPAGQSNDATASSLRRLNDDVLIEVIELLKSEYLLEPLSRTSKWIREACKPALFRRASITAGRLCSYGECFIPRPLWPYVQVLCFFGPFERLSGGNEDRLCKIIQYLEETFLQMPRLRSFQIQETYGYGFPWRILETMLSIPHLSSMEIFDHLASRQPVSYVCDMESAPQSYPIICAPLRQCLYTLPGEYRAHPRSSPLDIAVLSSIVEQRSQTLEALEAPSEAFLPFDCLAQHSWPRLRSLSLIGQRGTSQTFSSRPIVSLFGDMPSLQSLKLDLAIPVGARREALWPLGFNTLFPWPHLRRLSVTYPHPEDQLYSHLPPTLTSLTLRCWPRHFIHQVSLMLQDTIEGLGWQSPIPTASEILRIVRRCRSTYITQLEIEYEADGDESALLGFLPHAFPNVQMLTIIRYRTEGMNDIGAVELGQTLKLFSCLRVLRIHLDSVLQPHPVSAMNSDAGARQLVESRLHFLHHANTYVEMLGPSIELMCFLQRRSNVNEWIPFHVVQGINEQRRAQFNSDTTILEDKYDFPGIESIGPRDF